MKIIETYEDGPVLIEPDIFKDDRGYFYESFNEKEFKDKVANVTFVQDNQSKSKFGTIRGMHFQKGDWAQAKLVRVVKGGVVDVVVNIMPDSKHYLETYHAYLSEHNHRQFFVPRGFAHGFIAVEPDTIFQYKCDNYYNKESEGSFNYKDVKGFDWSHYVPEEFFIVSEKDNNAQKLDDCNFSTFNGISKYKKHNELDLKVVEEALNPSIAGYVGGSIYDPQTILNLLKLCNIEMKDGRSGKIKGLSGGIYDPENFSMKMSMAVETENGEIFVVKNINDVLRIYYDGIL